MLHDKLISLTNSVSPAPGSSNRSEKPQREIGSSLSIIAGSLFAGLLATQALAFSNVAVVNPKAIAQTTQSSNPESNPGSLKAEDSVYPTHNPLPDGVYLYGESAELNQLGKTYMVFESRGGKMIGALYMPQSEFHCFYGDRQRNDLALTVVDSYDRMTHPFTISIAQQYPVASASDRPTSRPLTLEGLQAIENLSDLDRELLGTCKQNHQEEIW
jgi:hypothetical protein